jgi:HK97 gp10 family phage protein
MGFAMAGEVSAKIEGLDDLRRVLAEIPRDLRKKVILSALRKAARVPLQKARQTVPVMDATAAAKNPYRTAGLLKKRLMVRTSKQARRSGNLGVFINVRPADGAKWKRQKVKTLFGTKTTATKTKASQRGAYSPNDPFYWRFVEFGTKKMKARPFIQPAADTLPQALEVFKAEVIPQINKFNSRKK